MFHKPIAILVMLCASLPLIAKDLPAIYQDWLDVDVAYIITAPERAQYLQLSSPQQWDKFIEKFWARRDPMPGNSENEFKKEHYRRMAFANQHFAAGHAGWSTDRGRIYIQYGPPDEIEPHHFGDKATVGTRHAYEVWRFNNIEKLHQRVSIRFVDTCDCSDYRLEPGPLSEP